MQQPNGKIFLSAERGHTETERFRSYNKFKFGSYQNDHKASFGNLYVVNDDTLAGGQSISLEVEEDSLVFLLTVVGAMAFKDGLKHESLVEAGQVLSLQLKAETSFIHTNPFENDLVNFIQIWIKQPVTKSDDEAFCTSFNIDESKNQILHISQHSKHCKLFIAKMGGRQEMSYNNPEPGKEHFLFVIEGAFEAQNILLEARDGLGLSESTEIEMEALSNNAIIILLELAVQ
jgi:redox-sensitive bicupin YhaK (pirin superfamily)